MISIVEVNITMKKEENPELTGSEIAVTGMAGRFPGAANITEFWENLKNGVESITIFSDEELEVQGIDPRLLKDPNYIKARGSLSDIEYFDASFFGFTPTDAKVIDPQTRLFLECAWEALEDAGYDPGSYDGFIGLFAGASDNIIWKIETRLAMRDHPDNFFGSLINNKDFLSLLVSYKLNLKGPSFTMYTACSSSLTAIHLACQAILNGECDMALAGGATILLPNRTGSLYRPGMLNSPDGHCRSFDARAGGTIFGSGVGLVALKLLEDAIQDKDHIYAVVKGAAINNDGLRKVGFTAPSIEGQEEVIRTAQQVAHVEPESIGYIEAHGTATELGDPIEIEALKMVFDIPKKQCCAIGSVKTNVGHLDSAAGVTGFIKTVLALKHRLIPPSLHFETPNPKIDFKNSPFYVNTRLQEWESNGALRRAGVSSFGIGGTNAHVVLEEWPESDAANELSVPQLILLSAHTPSALERMARNFAVYLKKNPGIRLADMAYTLAVGRKHFKYRRWAVGSSLEEIIEKFSAPDSAPAPVEKGSSDFTEIPPGREPEILKKIGLLWLQGRRFDWEVFYSHSIVNRVSLPTYPFERQFYWIEERLLKMMGQPGISTSGDAADTVSLPEKRPTSEGMAAAPDLKPRPHMINPYIPPSTALEQDICDTWKKLFGFEEIGINDDFYELGGDSVKAITLTSEFEKIGCEVSITDILSNTTIKKLGSLIGERNMSKELEDEIYEQRLLRDLDCLEKLNKGRAGKNIFILHPNSGMLNQYKELALLLEKKYNVYGIKARGPEPGTNMWESPRQMVDDYVEQILIFQESGPYTLAGFGIGNMLAYEIGRKLELLNHQVEKIVMLDPSVFITGRGSRYRKMPAFLPGLVEKAVLALGERKFKRKIRSGKLIIREDDNKNVRKEKVKKYMDILNTCVLSFGVVQAPLSVLQTMESPAPGATRERFERLTGSSVSFARVPGDHDSMLEKPVVEKLAQLIINNL